MNFFGTYHADIRPQALGICDAPQIFRGQMALSGFETASERDCMALVYGAMRNRRALARRLDCPPACTPAQILLHAYKAWGDAFLNEVEGACLCCIADVQRDRMLLARDRMGENMIFYAWREGALAFADHPDMLLQSGFVAPVVGRAQACEMFGLGPARTPGKTFIRGLYSLPAGMLLVCENGKMELRRYYAPAVREHTEDENTTIEHTLSLLESCADDVMALHPACMLSGGIDSTALTVLLSEKIGKLETFSVDYRGNDADFVANAFRPEKDAPYIEQAVRAFGTSHHRVLLEQNQLADALEEAVQARGFPGMADIDASLLLFAREIVRRAPAVVSGECGDEVFGGYPWFREDAQISQDYFPWSGSMELRESVLKPELRKKLQIRQYVRERMHESLESYDVSGVNAREKPMFRLQRLCFDYFMQNLQERAVQMCDWVGLKVLTPLCDVRLVEYVYNVPWKMKRMGGMEKGLFRAAMAGVLPEKLRMRKKSPYPKTCSATYTAFIRERIQEMCAEPDAPLWRIADLNAVSRIANSKLDPAETPWFGQLMAGPQFLAYLLQINAWMQKRNIEVDLE